MLGRILIFLFFPLVLISFEKRSMSPFPVVGYQEVLFLDPFQQINRHLLIWYPVNPQTFGITSNNPWDQFKIAVNAPPSSVTQKMPIIVISHGNEGNPHQLSWLIRELTHSGFVVIGLQHLDRIHEKVQINFWQRAQDVSTMITQFHLSSLAGMADFNKIGIAGYSLGGTAAVWISGARSTKLDSLVPGPDDAHPKAFDQLTEALPSLDREMMTKDWKDERVKAAFIMAPACGWIFDAKSLGAVVIPVYFVAPEEDQVVVTKNNARFFARSIPHAVYQEIPGKAGHFVFISALNALQMKEVSPSWRLNTLLEDDVSVDRSWIQIQTADEAVRFFNSVFR
jgi:predicted dienelactone hydrolase